MDTEKNLAATRHKLYKFWTMDGIGELTIGLSFLSLGALVYFDSPIFVTFCALAGALPILLKKRFVFPRTGYYTSDSAPATRDINSRFGYFIVSILILLTALGVMKATGMSFPSLIEDNVLILAGLLFTAAIIAGALYTGIKRVYFYAALTLGLFIHGSLRTYPTTDGMDLVREALGLHIIVFGAVCFLIGCAFFVRFLIKYPVIKDVDDEKE
ncbi:MAG: hypothetical protein KOO63_14570 [Bacteroidales bacterium]|nr:hypothetical protein [Candidatus Latescibacterota bacterium]